MAIVTTYSASGKLFIDIESTTGNVIAAYAFDGSRTAAKSLYDNNGNAILNPQTGEPYIVPLDYNPNAAISFGTQQANLLENAINIDISPAGVFGGGGVTTGAVASNITSFALSFRSTGSLDVQTNYNGISGSNVPAFTPVASYHYGLASAAYGLTLDAATYAGGKYNSVKSGAIEIENQALGIIGVPAQNVPNTGGIYGNNINNPANIEAGHQAFQNGVWGNPPSTSLPSALNESPSTVQNSDGSLTVTSPDGKASDTIWVDALGRFDKNDLVIQPSNDPTKGLEKKTEIEDDINIQTGSIQDRQTIVTASNGQVEDAVIGQGANVNQTNASITLAPGTTANIQGDNNTINAGDGASLQTSGSNNTFNFTTNDYAYITNGLNNTVNGDNASDYVNLANNTFTTINGSGGGFGVLGTGISVAASNETAYTLNNVSFNLTGSSDNLYVGAGSYVGLMNGDQNLGIFTNGSSIATQDNVSFNLTGNGNTATLAANNYIGMINGDQGNTVIANNDQIGTQDNVSFNLIGSGDTATLAANNYIGMISGDQGNTIIANNDQIATQDNVSFNLVGSGDSARLAGNNYIGLISGDKNISIEANNDQIVTQNNVGFTLSGSGDNVGIGADSIATINGDYETISLSGRDTITENGSYDAITDYTAGYDFISINGNYDTSYENNSYVYDNGIGDSNGGLGDNGGGGGGGGGGGYGYYGYYGFAGHKATITKALGQNIGSIAQFDLANGNIAAAKAAEAGHQEAYDASLKTSGSSVLTGAKQDNSQVVTWSLANSAGTSAAPFSGYIDTNFEQIVQQAFATWGQASGLEFKEVSDSTQSDIRLGWGQFDTQSTGVLGYTNYQASNGFIKPDAIIRLEDPTQTKFAPNTNGQLIYDNTDASLSQLLLHEIGHVIGLGSNSDPNSVMNYQLTSNNHALDATDILGAQSIYNAGFHSGSSQIQSADLTSLDGLIKTGVSIINHPETGFS